MYKRKDNRVHTTEDSITKKVEKARFSVYKSLVRTLEYRLRGNLLINPNDSGYEEDYKAGYYAGYCEALGDVIKVFKQYSATKGSQDKYRHFFNHIVQKELDDQLI